MSSYYPEQVWNSDDEESIETEDHKYRRLTQGMSRADVLLLLIEQHCLTYPGAYWSPPKYGKYLMLGRDSVCVNVGGPGDAAALRGLERRGLIRAPYPTQFDTPPKYSYDITDGGKLRAQEIA